MADQLAQEDAPEGRSGSKRNPSWDKNELILTLSVYLEYDGNPPGKASDAIQGLSDQLARYRRSIHSQGDAKLRNPNGVYMKLMNFRRFDPHYQETGRVGLTRGNALEEVVWQEFAHDRTALAAAAKEIRDASTKPGEAFHTDASETEDASSLERAWDVLDQQTPPERREYLRELVVRNRRHVADLKALYQGVCQVSGRQVLEGLAGDITEVHHIEWLTRGGSDAMSNMVVLAPDIHAAIHTADAVFDWRELAFVINGKRLPLVVNRHLRPR